MNFKPTDNKNVCVIKLCSVSFGSGWMMNASAVSLQ